MVDDGLYEKVPAPNIVLGPHLHAIKAGVVALSGGPILTAVESFELRNFGKSGHISRPDICVDPVITAAHIVVRLQSIVTKETRPEDFAVVACASIHGGSTANIVPDFVDIKVSIRSYRPEVHEHLVAAVKRVIRAEFEASGSLAVHEPQYKKIMHMPAIVMICTMLRSSRLNSRNTSERMPLARTRLVLLRTFLLWRLHVGRRMCFTCGDVLIRRRGTRLRERVQRMRFPITTLLSSRQSSNRR